MKLTATKSFAILLTLIAITLSGCDDVSDQASGSPSTSSDSSSEADSAEADYKTWLLDDGIFLSAWASGDNRTGETTFVWINAGSDDDYADLDAVAFQVTPPTGQPTSWEPVPFNEPQEAGDPNYGSTFVPSDTGRHRITLKVAPADGEEQILEGLYFDVD